MAIQIITDSTSDLTEEELQKLNVHMIHMRVIFEDGIYTDGVDITKEGFYEKQAAAKTLPKTTQVNPQEYCDIFESLLQNGDEVVAILLSSKLSGTFQSAMIAKGMAEGGERLHLVDSLNVTIGEGLLVREAVRLRDAGKTAAEIAAAMEELKYRVRFVAFIGTLKYLKMGGRISASTAVLGTMLNISPVVAIVDGEVKSVGRVKGKQKILEYTLDFANHYPIDGRHCVMFGHSRCLETMEIYREKCVKALAIKDYHWDELGAVIGTHAGPGCYGLAYIGLK
ncbi:EDD domain protein, DegV family [Oscillibacter sp. PC13]|uniref:DegV family protein n=1 Tax=Oscillibacter sp. PC13 TaxID=1855299 RepID=UPI0008EC2CEA|nr:DegV family protein [Oscillibacter sp. PC13]SFP60822.1 EDD domain protein, DegV family [Oscillibacter sp. PC13]